MPIDARIPLGAAATPGPGYSPLATYSKAMDIQRQQKTDELAGITLDETKRVRDEQEALRKAYAVNDQGAFDEEMTIRNLEGLGAAGQKAITQL